MLVSMKAVLDLADAKKIAVGAFNITSLEGIQAVLGAAEELGQPVILQFAPVHESIIPLKAVSYTHLIPADLKEILKPEDVDFLSQSAMDDACRPGNPKDPSFEDIKNLYLSLM